MARHASRHWHHFVKRSPLPEIANTLENFATPVARLMPRSTDNCGDGSTDRSSCGTKPTSSSNTMLPIILGSAIPIVIAVVVLMYLHRRHTIKLRKEDAMDRTKSMDFGLDLGPASKKGPMVHVTGDEKESQSRRQVSMELDSGLASPYIMPPAAIAGSTESLTSLARTMTQTEDPYSRSRNKYGATPSMRSKSVRTRDSSIYSPDDTGLLKGAQGMGKSDPFADSSPVDAPSIPEINLPTVPAPVARSPSPMGLPSSPKDGNFAFQREKDLSSPPLASPTGSASGMPSALQVGLPSPSFQLGSFEDQLINGPTPTINRPLSDATTDRPLSNDESVYDDAGSFNFRLSAASAVSGAGKPAEPAKSSSPEPPKTPPRQSLMPAAYDGKRLSMGFRPLPPDGKSDDTAEERALRIRSFYKEYFSVEEGGDPNAPPVPNLPRPGPPRRGDFGNQPAMYDDNAAIYDPETGRFVMAGAPAKPFAEPPMRRAMTPPPRMPPRFMGGGPGGPGPRSRAGSNASSGKFISGGPGPRSQSSLSNRPPGPAAPRRPIEPPKPLNLLPTPAMLSEDAFSSPIMFAPPVKVPRDGSESPSLRGGLRPYSPSVMAHTPLASAWEEMPALPTPSMMRKSGTFTALDFAPPKKPFSNDGDQSDAGSIRSNKSGLSASHIATIRNGGNRVSRIPKNVVPVKDDMANMLKPTMNMQY